MPIKLQNTLTGDGEKKKKKKMGRKILYQSFCLQMFCIFFPWEIFLSELKALKFEARDNKGDREPLGVALSICIFLMGRSRNGTKKKLVG